MHSEDAGASKVYVALFTSLYLVTTPVTIACPVCRERMNADEISRVDRRRKRSDVRGNEQGTEQSELVDVVIKGSWGTKIDAVLKTAMQILAQDDHSKILVFSQWPGMLVVLREAFSKNSIRFVELEGDKKKVELSLFSVFCLTWIRRRNRSKNSVTRARLASCVSPLEGEPMD